MFSMVVSELHRWITMVTCPEVVFGVLRNRPFTRLSRSTVFVSDWEGYICDSMVLSSLYSRAVVVVGSTCGAFFTVILCTTYCPRGGERGQVTLQSQ